MKNENFETAVPSGVPGGETTGPVAAVSTRERLIKRLHSESELLRLARVYGTPVLLKQAADMLAAATQPAVPQGPVCRWCSSDQGHWEWLCANCGHHDDVMPAPRPQRPRLTDDELTLMWHDAKRYANPTAADAHLRYARAIEKKVRGEE